MHNHNHKEHCAFKKSIFGLYIILCIVAFLLVVPRGGRHDPTPIPFISPCGLNISLTKIDRHRQVSFSLFLTFVFM